MRLPRSLRARLLLAGLASALLAPAPATAVAADVAVATPATLAAEPDTVEPVFPGLNRQVLDLRLRDGAPAVANLLTFSAADPGLELVGVLAAGRVPGLATVPAMGAREHGDGVVAGVNGGFWLSNPVGDPNGYFAQGGALLSEAQTQGAGPRGTVAVTGGGGLVFDRLSTSSVLTAGADELSVTGFNRYDTTTGPYPDGPAPVFVYTPEFGEVTVRTVTRDGVGLPLAAAVVDGLRPPAFGQDSGSLTTVTTAPGSLLAPDSGAVVVAHGAAAATLAGLAAGDEVAVLTEPRPLRTDPAAWAGVTEGLAAGPLIVAEGRPTDPAGWENEGFAPQVHSLVRAPRTAIGRTAAEVVLLVTVDGRQPGYSSGMTIAELADLLVSLGAVDALSLDGGGSTQIAVDGLLRNRPCCDTNLRPVANGVFVRHRYRFDASERLWGANREETAAEVALAAFPDGAGEVVIASGATFPDALAGGPLAAVAGGPLLLTGRDALSLDAARALDSLQPETVTVLGGSAAIGPAVVDTLTTRGHAVRRLAGPERVATAAAVAAALGPAPRVFLASAADFPDALTAAAPAGLLAAPVLLTGRDALAPEVRELLATGGAREVVVAGGEAAVGAGVVEELTSLGVAVTRLAGPDRFATSRAVNDWAVGELACDPAPGGPETTTPGAAETATAAACLDPSGLVVARGDVFADALAGGPLAAARRHLLAIVPRTDVRSSPDVAAYLDGRDAGLARVTLLGGPAALSSYQHWQLDQLAR